METKPTRIELEALGNAFLALPTPAGLAEALGVGSLHLHALALDPPYKVFHIPKKDGSLRLIEDPQKPLKGILRRLNRYLQAVYYFKKTEAAYGFMLHCANDEAWQHRNIVNNARRHTGCAWLLNVDLEDFFHHVKSRRLARLFLSPPFSFDKDLTRLLTMLTTYKGRLPMGAPTSPVLSNFASILLDGELLLLARMKGWTFTRYADDMSFSSPVEITVDDATHVRDYIRAFEFYPNEQKVKLFKPGDVKMVTGLVVGEKDVQLPAGFVGELEQEIARLGEVSFVQGKMGRERSRWVEGYRQRIGGMLEFASYVLGERHETVTRLEHSFQKTMEPPDDFGAYSWLDFPYW